MKKKLFYIIIGGIILSYLLYFFIKGFTVLHKFTVVKSTDCVFCKQLNSNITGSFERIILNKRTVGYGIKEPNRNVIAVMYLGKLNRGQIFILPNVEFNDNMLISSKFGIDNFSAPQSPFDIDLSLIYPICDIKTIPCPLITSIQYKTKGKFYQVEIKSPQCIQYEFNGKSISFSLNHHEFTDISFTFPKKIKISIELHAVSDSLFMVVGPKQPEAL